MLSVNERIEAVRARMKEANIDVYYIPNEDDHLSDEYTAPYFQCKSFISGFSGDAGCVIITRDFAGLWTDGRYFTQAEDELKGTCVELMRLRQPGVPDPVPFLIEHTPQGGVLGFDGNVVSTAAVQQLSKALSAKKATIDLSRDFAGDVWGKDRPDMPMEPVYLLDPKYTGETAAERMGRVREAMKKNGADVLILTHLEDPCWLFNIRGNDIACTPVAYAFAIITMDGASYFIDPKKVPADVKADLEANGVSVKDYDALADELTGFQDKTIWVELRTFNAYLYAHLDTSNRILNMDSPVTLFRAVKNETEIRCMHSSQLKDGAAMAEFICWVKEHHDDPQLTELSAAQYLDARRAEKADFIEPSFPTISAYGPNAAMMHYEATPEKFSKCEPHGFLLVDSGGTYKDGTTDVTRSISLGEPTELEKKYYTLVLKGHLDLELAHFLQGTIGNNLDILARRPLWNIGIDYQCGTGHGVGHVLSVHEGPHGIRWGRSRTNSPAEVLVPGMIVTDEPGIYLPHELGIRIENDLQVVKDVNNFYGQFLKFEAMTLVPYDRESIDVRLLDDTELEAINAYHAVVYEKISPLVEGKVKTWLRQATEPITR